MVAGSETPLNPIVSYIWRDSQLRGGTYTLGEHFIGIERLAVEPTPKVKPHIIYPAFGPFLKCLHPTAFHVAGVTEK